ncbi:MAG: class I SAM-dependent methyltransferase [Bacteroidetes bacterium QS_9_68_14]|nr:MAG: class I SAM-dependent methyltransferase [Bacteroidetes bacterium QS_9_68_14]
MTSPNERPAASSPAENDPSEAIATDGAPATPDSPNFQKYTSGGPLYHWHLRQFMHRLYEMTARTAPRSVLDAGCGEGFVTRFLREQNADWDLTGVDMREAAIRYARRHAGPAGARYEEGDLYDLPFAADAFDTVVCSEVLEHLDRPDEALAELRRVARRAVVVSVPREPYFRWLNDLGRALGLSPDPGHVNFWNERSFRRFVRRHLRDPQFATKHVYQLARGRVA